MDVSVISERSVIDLKNYFILTTDDHTLSLNYCLNYRAALLYFSVATAKKYAAEIFQLTIDFSKIYNLSYLRRT